MPFVPDDLRARNVGERLRQAFDDVIAEPLPEIFADLLRQLD